MNISLKANEPLPIVVVGQWVYLSHGLQNVTLVAATGDRVTLIKGGVVKSDQEIGRVLVYSPIDQDINIEFGYGDFTPPSDIAGQSVNIAEMPNVTIQQMPKLEIAEAQSIAVSSLPHIQLSENQSIAVSQLPKLEIAENQSVKIAQLPVIKIAANQSVKLMLSNTLVATESVMPLSIAENSERTTIHIKAKSTNTSDILINGIYPIGAGEKLELKTRAAFEITGAELDSVIILEC